MSVLEEKLLAAPAIEPGCEHETEILRAVLRREIGTPDQRNALIRIIEQNKVRRPILPKLLKNLGEIQPIRGTYINRDHAPRTREPAF